jgi:hypothetical protein
MTRAAVAAGRNASSQWSHSFLCWYIKFVNIRQAGWAPVTAGSPCMPQLHTHISSACALASRRPPPDVVSIATTFKHGSSLTLNSETSRGRRGRAR